MQGGSCPPNSEDLTTYHDSFHTATWGKKKQKEDGCMTEENEDSEKDHLN